MRYAIFVFALYFFTACTVPPQSHTPEAVAAPVVLPEIEVRAEGEIPPARKSSKKTRLSAAPCAGIATGDEIEDVRAKLDCLTNR